MSDYYEDLIADLSDEIDELNDEVLSLERVVDYYRDREADLCEYAANELCSPTMKLWQMDRIVKWLVNRILELEKEKVND